MPLVVALSLEFHTTPDISAADRTLLELFFCNQSYSPWQCDPNLVSCAVLGLDSLPNQKTYQLDFEPSVQNSSLTGVASVLSQQLERWPQKDTSMTEGRLSGSLTAQRNTGTNLPREFILHPKL